MELEILKLVLAFLAIVMLIWLKRPLYQAILVGILTTAVLYGIGPVQSGQLVGRVCTDRSAMSIVLVLYLITFLQRMLEKREQIKLAGQDLDRLFHNRRINASVAPLFIGLLPSAAAMILCGNIVKEATEGYLDKKEQAFVTSWFRHIPESTLPTYSGVLLMSNLAGVPLPGFMAGMVVPIICLFGLGYLSCLRKLPKATAGISSTSKGKNALGLLLHLWSLLAIILLILAFGLPVVTSIIVVILAAVPIYRFRWVELRPMFRQAVEVKLLLNTFLILVFKEFVTFSGVIHLLPDFFARLPIPMYLVFSLLFFFGGVVSGTSGIIALGTPLAFTAIPDGGMPLMVLLMCMCHAASQVSPTHVCLAVATEYFGVSLGELVRKTMPSVLVFCASMVVYYCLLKMFIG